MSFLDITATMTRQRGVLLPRRGWRRHFTVTENFSGEVAYNAELFDKKMARSVYAWDIHLFIRLFTAERELRMLVQREEHMRTKGRAYLKAINSTEDKVQVCELDSRLDELNRKYVEKELELHECELDLFERPLKEMYDNLRKDSTWYLRTELVEDCIAKGGCCSRDCGCCQKRHWTSKRNRGIGHCSVECGCCVMHRGFEMTQEQKENQRMRFAKKLHDENPNYLLHMIEAYFSIPRRKIIKAVGEKPVKKPSLKGN